MDKTNVREKCGRVELSPTRDVVAGSYNTWKITFTIGSLGMDDVSQFKLASNMTSDWGTPQFDHPREPNYATVDTSGEARVEARFDDDGHERPWKHTVTVDVFDGALNPGETVALTLGDTTGGSMGHRAQTYPEDDFRLIPLVDPFGTGEFIQLHDELAFDIVPGRATELEAVGPSTADVGEEVCVSVRAEDYWGNVATEYTGSLAIESDGERLDFLDNVNVVNGIGHMTGSVHKTGPHRLRIVDEDREMVAVTNPVVVGTDPERRLFWGDIHGQSEETVGTGDVKEYFAFARDHAFLDFASHAGNDFQITDEFWEVIKRTIRDFHDPGQFTTFLCYEWSANTVNGGDHNVYFRDMDIDEEIHRSSNWQIADGLGKYQGTYPVEELYDHYGGRDDVLIIPHQGGRPATLDVLDPDLSPFVEIVSAWGVFEWFGDEALERGYHVGFVGGSDDHTGRPGLGYPTNQPSFNIKGGLMAARADDLTRESLWEAFTERRCYATTGARIHLDVDIEGNEMGSSVAGGEDVSITATVNGTAPIERIDLFRNGERIAFRLPGRDEGAGTEWIELVWQGERSRDRHKVVSWDGGVSLTRGRIEAVEEIGFDHPEQGVEDVTDTAVEWTSATSGNYQGIRLNVDDPAGVTLSFNTPPLSTSFSLEALTDDETVQSNANGQRLVARRVSRSTQMDAIVSFSDKEPTEGDTYYVRARQIDGEMAWCSPVIVEE